MGVLTAGVVIVGAVVALNLLLTFGVIRRLREHTDLLADGAGASRRAPTMAGVGETVGPFAATAVDGGVVSLDRFEGVTLVGVFSVGCGMCEEKLPLFVEHARDFPGGRERVLAVVVASEDGEAEAVRYVHTLSDTAVVVQEPPRGPVSAALGVTGYPAFGLVGAEGVVRASALDPGGLPSQEAGIARST